ncbi:UDP-forming cellulose synthase catalytic subunit [Trichlorobacter ammonificans]|nr:UDP-forming cellulose synthase catalytic subunit [Trichlorobacter ammonificans]
MTWLLLKLRLQRSGGGTTDPDPLLDRHTIASLTVIASALLLYCYYALAGIHLSLEKQYLVGWGCVLLLVLCGRIERFKRPPLRIVFILLSTFVAIRYMIWRTSETLVYDGVLNFIGMALLYLAELYALTLHLLGVFANIWPLETKIIPLPEDTTRYPSVDIFIPTYNEDPEMVKVTATAALNIDYPRELLHIHILDDGATVDKRNDPQNGAGAWERYYTLKRVARELGVNYLTRRRNSKAKAGNLNHALAHTGADLVLVLDCDHVPTRDILKNTVGWFLKDDRLAFVQTPHFFINPNPIEKNIDILKDAPSENEMFYRACHPGLNFWNASFFCGSAAILRRRYLLEVGGVAGETITEDCETALALHQRGYNSVFIPRPMVCGLSPETFDDFILQRSRWAQGMTQMMVLNNPLFARGLKFYQRICYFNNGLFWLFGVSRFIFIVAPAAFLLLNMHVYFASLGQVAAFALPHLFASVILADFLYGKYRWPFLSELYESIQSVFLMPVVFSVFLNPRKPSFKVTPKGKNLENDFLSGLSVPFFLMCSILLLAVPVGVLKWFEYPLHRDVIALTLLWSLYNIGLAMAAFGAFYEKRQIRKSHRLWATGNVLVVFPGSAARVEAAVQDISMSGLGILLPASAAPRSGEQIRIESRDSMGRKHGVNAVIQRIVPRDEGYFCGTEFLATDAAERAEVVRFVYTDSQRWVDYWSRPIPTASPLRMLVFVSAMALKGIRISLVACSQLVLVPVRDTLRNLGTRLFSRLLPDGP